MFSIKLTLNKKIYPILIKRIIYIAIYFYNKTLIRFRLLINEIIRYKIYSKL